MYLKRLCFGGEIHLPSSGSRPDRTGENSGNVAYLNAFVYDVMDVFYIQDLVFASKMKMKKMGKRKNVVNAKENLINVLSTNRVHHA